MPTSSRITWRDRLRYRFENTLSRGTVAIIGWLALLSAGIVALATLAIWTLRVRTAPDDGTSSLGALEGAWQSMLHALDPGTLAGDQGWLLRALMLVVTVGGIFIVSMLIGTITSGLDARLQDMRKGRSRVIESNHTLILGWSSKVFSIIGELMIANENQKRPCIVILADRDKVEMEDDIRAKFPDTKNTRVICRSGDPLDLDDLAVVAPHEARSIIVLAPETENPDIHVIKSVLAITNNPDRREGAYHVVAEIRDAHNLEAAHLVGGKEAVFVQGADLIARVTAQTCRQSGLSVVYTELLDFDGAEIYFTPAGSLSGRSYREVLSSFEDSAVIGLMHGDGEVQINPVMETVLRTDDQIIAISEDDDTLIPSKTAAPMPDASCIVDGAKTESMPERTLVLGWNEKTEAVIRELDNYVAAGSKITVIRAWGEDEASLAAAGALKRQRMALVTGDIASLATLEWARVTEYDHIIVMSDTRLPIQEADAQTLICLLHLRNLAEAAGKDLSIVSEMMDLRNRALAQVARADDFIVSDTLVSLMLSQLSENRHLDRVFRTLFSADGSEIYIRHARDYIAAGYEVDFHTVIEAAARRGETAIGYRIVADGGDPAQGFGVKVNPNKSARIRFAADDQLIVLAED
ncbi:MAG: potassium transporter TrkA [Lysobacter sp.]|nr:potassium transporter TrkA [Lysobacter sp.]